MILLKTRMIDISTHTLESAALEEVAAILRAGGIVAVPTETVYGLAANALDPQAVEKIFRAKGRPQDNPLIVHVSDREMLLPLVDSFPPAAQALADRFWPGPLTLVLSKSAVIPLATSAGLDTVGIRMPSHPVMRAIIRCCGLPLAAPSANLSGSPSTTTAQHCIDDLSGRVDAIVRGGDCPVGLESTVVSLCGPRPRLLRPGSVTYEDLCAVLGPVEMDDAVLEQADPTQRVSAPGMKYKHYAPKARVHLLLGSSPDFCRYVNAQDTRNAAALCFAGEEQALCLPTIVLGQEEHPETMAHTLFAALRDFDRKGVQTVYAHSPQPKGVGLAVYNRLIRAAAFDVTRL